MHFNNLSITITRTSLIFIIMGRKTNKKKITVCLQRCKILGIHLEHLCVTYNRRNSFFTVRSSSEFALGDYFILFFFNVFFSAPFVCIMSTLVLFQLLFFIREIQSHSAAAWSCSGLGTTEHRLHYAMRLYFLFYLQAPVVLLICFYRCTLV